MRLPANGIPKFDGIDDLRRLVQAPPRVLDDVEQSRVSDLVDELYEVGEDMPFGYRSSDLGHALATVDRRDAGHLRDAEQVRAAWDVRFSVDLADPLAQARMSSRMSELITGAPATLESQRGIAELRTLAHLTTGTRHLPSQLEITTPGQLDDVLRQRIAAPLVRSGSIDDAGRDFIARWQLARDPVKVQAWRATVDEAATGRGTLPDDASIELLLSPASNWEARTATQRTRLLDALASAGDGPMTTARARTRNPRNVAEVNDRDVKRHLGTQVGRALRGDAPLPTGITAREIVETWHYRRAAPADRRALLEQHSQTSPRAIFDEFQDQRDSLDPIAVQVGRRQVNEVIAHAHRSRTPVPTWVEVADIVTAPLTERQRAHMLAPFRGAEFAGSPQGAAATLVHARVRLFAEQLGGGVEGTRAVRSATTALIDRNLQRISGTVADGYGGHPDYAEIGRVEANLALLTGFQGAARASAERETAAAAAATTGSILPW